MSETVVDDPLRAYLRTVVDGTANAMTIPRGVTPEVAERWLALGDEWTHAQVSIKEWRRLYRDARAEAEGAADGEVALMERVAAERQAARKASEDAIARAEAFVRANGEVLRCALPK